MHYHLLLRQEFQGCPLLFLNKTLGSFLCIGDRNPIHSKLLGSGRRLEECLIIIHDPGMQLGPESNREPLD